MRTHTDVHGRVPAPGGGGASEYVVSFKIRDLSRSGDGGGGRTKAHGSRRPVCAGCAGCIRHGCGRSKSGRQPLGDTHPLQRRAPKPRCAPVQTSDDPVPKDEKPAEQAQDADPAELVLPAGHAVQAANVPGVSANVFAGQTGNRKCAATKQIDSARPGRMHARADECAESVSSAYLGTQTQGPTQFRSGRRCTSRSPSPRCSCCRSGRPCTTMQSPG